jgi:hypothetical protein
MLQTFTELNASGELERMNLIQFAQKFRAEKGSQKINKQYNSASTVIICSPDFVSNPESTSYPEYCYFTLMKFKSWSLYPESLYSGTQNAFHTERLTDAFRTEVVSVYNDFMERIEDTYNEEVPGYIQCRIDFMRQQNNIIEFTPTHDMMEGLDIDEQTHDEVMIACRSLLLGRNLDLIADTNHPEWDIDHSWTVPNFTYVELDDFPSSTDIICNRLSGLCESVKHALNTDEAYRISYRPIRPEQLRGNQVTAFNCAVDIIENK